MIDASSFSQSPVIIGKGGVLCEPVDNNGNKKLPTPHPTSSKTNGSPFCQNLKRNY